MPNSAKIADPLQEVSLCSLGNCIALAAITLIGVLVIGGLLYTATDCARHLEWSGVILRYTGILLTIGILGGVDYLLRPKK